MRIILSTTGKIVLLWAHFFFAVQCHIFTGAQYRKAYQTSIEQMGSLFTCSAGIASHAVHRSDRFLFMRGIVETILIEFINLK